MELVLIRHGESVANRQRILQGHLDSPLNETGLEQAERLAESLSGDRFAAILSSDLIRARDTAQAIAARLSMGLELDPDLREIGVGIFTGHRWTEIAERYPADYQRLLASGMDWSVVPEAEGEEAAQARLERFIGQIRERYEGERLAIVAHGAILRRMIRLLLGLPMKAGIDFELSNASCTELHLTPQGPRLVYLNRLPYEAARARRGEAHRPLV